MEVKWEEMLQETKKQLFEYPVTTKKQDVKYGIKRLLRPSHTPKRDSFFWPHALLAQSLETAGDVETVKKYMDLWLQKGMPIYNIDNVMNGCSLLYLYEKTKEDRYLEAAKRLYHFLRQYQEQMKGAVPYRKGNPDHIYVDGVGMIVPFLCRYGKQMQDREAVELGLQQLKEFMAMGMDTESGLPYHGYDRKTGIKYGIIGWGRALGWLLLALSDCYEYTEKEDRIWLKENWETLLKVSLNYLRSDGYFSWQLPAKEGPKDTSATSMIGYSFQKARTLGVIDSGYEEKIGRMEAAVKKSVRKGRIGDCSGECQGFSQYPQVYGVYPWSQGPGMRFLYLRKERPEI